MRGLFSTVPPFIETGETAERDEADEHDERSIGFEIDLGKRPVLVLADDEDDTYDPDDMPDEDEPPE